MDYTAVANVQLTFTSATLQRLCVNIDITDDLLVEQEELFIVQLEQDTLQGPQTTLASVTITDGEYPMT